MLKEFLTCRERGTLTTRGIEFYIPILTRGWKFIHRSQKLQELGKNRYFYRSQLHIFGIKLRMEMGISVCWCQANLILRIIFSKTQCICIEERRDILLKYVDDHFVNLTFLKIIFMVQY